MPAREIHDVDQERRWQGGPGCERDVRHRPRGSECDVRKTLVSIEAGAFLGNMVKREQSMVKVVARSQSEADLNAEEHMT